MKNYTAITAAYLAANGLTKIYVNDAATGERICRLVKDAELKRIQRSGRAYSIA